MFRQARALCPGPQVCGGVDERPATQERLDRRRARRGRHPGPHPAAAQPCRVGHRAGRRCGPRVRRGEPGPRCGADGRRAGRIRPSETGHRDRGGETAVHGLRWAGRERGEHRVLHVCDCRWALPGRRPDLGARRAARGPGPAGGAGHPRGCRVHDETPTGQTDRRRHGRGQDDATLVRRGRGVRPLPAAARLPRRTGCRVRDARRVRLPSRDDRGNPGTPRSPGGQAPDRPQQPQPVGDQGLCKVDLLRSQRREHTFGLAGACP